MKLLKDFKDAADHVPVRVFDTKAGSWHDVLSVYIEDDVMVVEI